jgi:putative MATE family efflux protein
MFSFLTLVSVVIGGVALFFRTPILTAMKTPEDAFSQALAYSTVCMCGLIFIYGYNMVSAVLRGLGDSKHPFVFISIAAVLNIILDLVFVLGLDMGAGGAALATVISQGVSFVSCAVFLVKKRDAFGITVKPIDFIKIDMGMLSSLLKLGFPMAIKSASISFSKIFVNSFLNGFGTTVSAFAGVANKLASIANLVSNSLNAAGSSMVGQNIGAGEYKRVPKIFLRVFAISAVISVVLSTILCLFPEAVFSIFTSGEDKAKVLGIAMGYIPIGVLMFFGSAFRSPANALINGSGNYKINFATAIFDGIVLRIGLSYLFGELLNGGYLGFFLGDALAGFTPFWIGIVFYLSGKWKTKVK